MANDEAVPGSEIRLVVADVDGTLVTRDKKLTQRSIDAVKALHARGVAFAITSGRPPRGMTMLVEPLQLATPIAAFNGGIFVHPDLSVIDQHPVDDAYVRPVVEAMRKAGLDVWLYRDTDWFIQDPNGPHVERETRTVQFKPKVVSSYDGLMNKIAKIVGVSDDYDAVAKAEASVRKAFGSHVSASRSQPYYLDATHPDANKGTVATRLQQFVKVPAEQTATIGDEANDIDMFKKSGLSIAMGNADDTVKQAADYSTASNEDEGFALAIERFILGAKNGRLSGDATGAVR